MLSLQLLLALSPLVLLGLLEAGLRQLGLGNPLIYLADEKIGYLLAPNQKVKRSGARIEINQYSMRGGPISPSKPAGTLRLLMLGDSIINGNWWTDQPNILSELLRTQLQPLTAQPVEVLNASANSWGPRNELAYLQRFGTFEADMLILVINTDDLFGIQPSPLIVGNDRNYPARRPPAAVAELWSRYLLKPKAKVDLSLLYKEPGDRVGFNLSAIEAIVQQAPANFLLVMTPLLRELGQPGPRDYELKARERLAELVDMLGISFLDFLPIFNSEPEPNRLYRDHIHLSPLGNQQLINYLVTRLKSHLS
ncbi:SGNH/GDSL hydrolase family protein [Leptolyngbya sp. FACHB-261]|uniref:SGNH/GDSL hydrolase family protein n=1 Tax=Leptolyngbya sp. FACHB-261 TaxID=2692806 RepID=UPI0016884C78|nr:SGNH/GDSL hydrolase family protein [Leptolyngbya sp. FACHB-261]MBD2102073.1 SGNH/GDSL hydrolase family protein [Leptolyngbya sp. FACHB-261]